MLIRPTGNDLRHIAHDLGRVIAIAGAAGVLPLLWAIAKQEWAPAGTFLLMIGIAALAYAAANLIRPPQRRPVDWSHGLVVAALTWLLAPALATIPLFLSGHYGSWIDSYFDSMSGLTTTGLAVIQDLDHLAESVNVWRHTLHFLGGQGIVLAVLVFLSGSGALSLYQGEGREEKIFPSVGSTARFIWLVSATHAVIGIIVLTIDGVFVQGFRLSRAVFHATTIFMAAFDTGGFSPQSTSVTYYHSPLFELMVSVLMVAGAMSFGLHHAIWNRTKGLGRNLEVRAILTTFGMTLFVTIVGLGTAGVFSDAPSLMRRGLFQVLSAHTGTGFATVSSLEIGRWSGLAFAGIATAMALGGMGSSTAGGVKALRVGLTFKTLVDSVRSSLLPERAIVPATFHQYSRRRLTADLSKSVLVLTLLYVGLYLFGALVSIAHGYPLQASLFESISAAANVGLSVGITAPDMPLLLKLTFVLQMWVGRLEFVAIFAMIGFSISLVAGE
ncbi:MAG: TrkH family potassium uptake protein [Acidimicrobiia bacterium]|nr:TrkH family potassium uptake protein [Acidimicrobiia bacterium]